MSWIRGIEKLVRRLINEKISHKIKVHFPAQVISYDGGENTCSLQPCIKGIRIEDPNNTTTIELPVLEDVPVRQIGSGKLLLSCAPQTGSYGLVHISDRSIEQWLVQGGIVDPGSSRQFDLSDAFFEPGYYPLVDDGDNAKIAVPILTDRIELRTRSGDTRIAVLDDETVEISTTKVTITDGTSIITLDGGAITIEGDTVDITGALDANGNFTVDA